MIVTEGSLAGVIAELEKEPILSVDVETTGLNAYAGDELFGFAIASPRGSFYFDFNGSFDVPADKEFVIEGFKQKNRHWIPLLKPLFDSPTRLWVNHNMKFDLGFLRHFGLEIQGPVYCTLVGARLEFNDHMQYSLDACAKRIGMEKDDAVKEYMDKHKLFTRESVPGKKLVWKNYRFNEVPLELVGPYAERDAKIALDLYFKQSQTFEHWEKTRAHKGSIKPVVALEQAMVKVIQGMEEHGIRIDRRYTEEAAAHEAARIALAKRSFTQASGSELVDSNKALAGVFRSLGIEPGRTKKGNPSFTDDVLERLTHPAAAALRDYRDANKRLGTYFSSFLYHSRKTGRVHCSINSGHTATGRCSVSNPNLQNLSDEDEETTPFPIRRAFAADPERLILSLDYKAVEYRVMLDLAGQLDVIAEVRGGKDLHQACADLMGVDRRTAKTINFLLLYGGGISKLALALFPVHHDEDTLKAICRRHYWQTSLKEGQAALLEGLDPARIAEDVAILEKADALQSKYFSKLPKVRDFIEGVQSTAQKRGYVFNWLGRRSHFPAAAHAYRAPNYIIQGGCADILKRAMVSVDALLREKKTRLMLTIHDELVLSLDPSEDALISEISGLMSGAYPHRHLPLECSAYVGETLHDLEERIPDGSFKGNVPQKACATAS